MLLKTYRARECTMEFINSFNCFVEDFPDDKVSNMTRNTWLKPTRCWYVFLLGCSSIRVFTTFNPLYLAISQKKKKNVILNKILLSAKKKSILTLKAGDVTQRQNTYWAYAQGPRFTALYHTHIYTNFSFFQIMDMAFLP
jgi:hypothetical protein